ncbi:acyl carrier protein [Streptomyces sp. NPDC048636]|uniref:acyl carrier protein n=1 Tax=Streptomyces sp. NPDC048636 TaxID=3155762 RepID=UPI0034465952
MTGDDITAVVNQTLTVVTGTSRAAQAGPEVLLEQGLGVDSLALLELVEMLQSRLGIVVPDEVTARIRTVADLRNAVARLGAASSSVPTQKDIS